MDVTMITTVKIIKRNSVPFEHAVSISKWPSRSVYIGNIIYYLRYLLAPFPKGLEVDLEGSNILPTLTLVMLIDTLSLFCHL